MPDILHVICGIVFIAIAIFVGVFKQKELIAGVNTMPVKEMNKIDFDYVCKWFGIFFGIIGFLFFISPFIFRYFNSTNFLFITPIVSCAIIIFMFVFGYIKKDRIYRVSWYNYMSVQLLKYSEINLSKIPSPCYVLNESLLAANLDLLSSVGRKTGVDIILALKGFATWGVFPMIKPFINGVSASSLHEARLSFEKMETLAHSYSPAYTDSDFDDILKYSSHITFNSLTQYERFRKRVHDFKKPVSMGLRINPEFSAVSADLYNPCSSGSRLGIKSEQIGDKLPADIEGLHVHALCESSAEATKSLIDAVESKFGHLFHSIKWLNLGGGHLMTRKDYNLQCLIDALTTFRAKYPHIKVILEPGAAFVWETGVLVATVEDIVENDNIPTAILNVSFTAHMPDCLEMPYKPRIRGASDEPQGKRKWRLGGNSCLAGDYIGEWSFDEEPYIGKRIVFEDMIHYTMVKTTTFNGVAHPSIGTWSNKGFKLLKQFDYNDYKNRLS